MKPAMWLRGAAWCAVALLVSLGAGRCLAVEPATKAAARPAPKMVIESAVLDLGDVVRGHDIRAEFRIRNEGEGDLRILRAKPG